MRTWFVVLVAGVACTGNSDDNAAFPADTAHSGSRLKLAWYEFADGLRTWASPTDLLDAQLGLPCKPTRWADGVTRCTPSVSGPSRYLDDACTQRVLAPDASLGIDAVVRCNTWVPTGSAYRGSGQTMQVPSVFSRDSTGACHEEPHDPSGRPFLVQTVGEMLSPSDFVTTRIAYQGSGDVVIATLRGTDGLLVPVQPYDVAHQASCDLAPLGATTSAPCFATESVMSDVFTDASCAQPAVRVDPECDRPPLAHLPTLGCPQYFEIGDQPSTGDLYQDAFSTCSANMTGDQPAYPLGTRVDASWLARGPDPSALREQLIYVGTSGTRVRDAGRLYDSELMTECTMESVADGATTRCRPSGGANLLADLSSDSGCTLPLPLLTESGYVVGCAVPTAPTIVDGGDHVYRIGALHTDDVYQGPVGACSKFPYPLYDLGEAIDAVRLPTAVKRRDP